MTIRPWNELIYIFLVLQQIHKNTTSVSPWIFIAEIAYTITGQDRWLLHREEQYHFSM